MGIYTKRGDSGETGLVGVERISKDAPRIEAIGTIDEANAVLGYVRSMIAADDPFGPLLRSIQVAMMNSMSHLARPEGDPANNSNPLPLAETTLCEEWIDRLEAEMGRSRYFLLPGGSPLAAQLHIARTVVRRAERRLVTLRRLSGVDAGSRDGGIAPFDQSILRFLNRLSDLCFVLARYELFRSELTEEQWQRFTWRFRRETST